MPAKEPGDMVVVCKNTTDKLYLKMSVPVIAIVGAESWSGLPV